MSEFKDEMTGAECVVSNITPYADYTIATKFPNALDGLKPIHKRCIWTLHNYVAKEHKTKLKEATLAGRVMEMHPHGDASISAAISTLAQPFTHIIPLIFSDSNVGSYSGQPPAAARYVDVAESDVAKELFFTDINKKMFKMVMCESEAGTEPAYFIPKIPTSLLVPVFGIAIGFQTWTAVCSVDELCELTKEYIRIRSKYPDWSERLKALVKYMLPDFPTNCVLRNSKQLLARYKAGDFDSPVLVDGTMKITNDRILIETLPSNFNFHTTVLKVGKMTTEKTSWESQNFQQMEDFSGRDQGDMKGAFNCVVRRGVNPFDVLAQLKKRVQFTSSWKPDRRYVDENDKMTSETPLSLLDKWYEVRKRAVIGDLKQSLNEMVDDQRKLMALIVVVDHTDAVVDIFKKAENEEATIAPLVKQFGLTPFQARYLSGLKLSQITARGKDELLQGLEKVRANMRDLQSKFSRVDEIMIEHVADFQKKYAAKFPRHCIIPKYIGTACYKGTGWIMLESEDEMDQILKDFNDPEVIEFNLFNGSRKLVALNPDEDIEGDIPKYLKAGGVAAITDNNNLYTACVCKNGGAMILEGLRPQFDNMRQAVPIGKKFTAITKTGERLIMDVTDKVIRKSSSAGPTMRDVVYVSPVVDEECIVIHASSAQPNYLLLEHVKGHQKLKKLVVGQWHVLAVLPVNSDRVIINIPSAVRARCSVRHLVLDNLDKSVPYGKLVGLLYGRGAASLKSDFEIVQWKRKSTIMKAKPKV